MLVYSLALAREVNAMDFLKRTIGNIKNQWNKAFLNWIELNWKINKLLLPHNLYSGAKHIPLFHKRPLHFHCSYWRRFHPNHTNTITWTTNSLCLAFNNIVTNLISGNKKQKHCFTPGGPKDVPQMYYFFIGSFRWPLLLSFTFLLYNT